MNKSLEPVFLLYAKTTRTLRKTHIDRPVRCRIVSTPFSGFPFEKIDHGKLQSVKLFAAKVALVDVPYDRQLLCNLRLVDLGSSRMDTRSHNYTYQIACPQDVICCLP
jgi:hypothetical protein